jgi:hypothetical protein
MDARQGLNAALWAFVASLVPLHGLLYLVAGSFEVFADCPALIDVLPASQLPLLVAWVMFGQSTKKLRIVIALILSLAVMIAAAQLRSSLIAILVEAGAWSLALRKLRRSGCTISQTEFGNLLPGPRFQFSLRTLFVATTIFAVALLSAKTIRGFAEEEHAVELVVGFFLIECGLVLSAMLALFAVLLPGNPGLRIAVGFVSSPGVGAAIGLAIGRDESLIDFAALLGGQSFVISGTLMFVRACGFRLVGPNVSKGKQPCSSNRSHSI